MTPQIRAIGAGIAVAAGLGILSGLASSRAGGHHARPPGGPAGGAPVVSPCVPEIGSGGSAPRQKEPETGEPAIGGAAAEVSFDANEPGDFTDLGRGILNDRATRFRVLDILASGAVPPGGKRTRLVEWLRATGDDEAIVRLDAVLRDLEARRYDAATADESRLLHAILDGDVAARREALETIRPELLGSDAVRATIREIALGSDAVLARAAVVALARAGEAEAPEFLESLLGAAGLDPEVRAAAAGALAARRGETVSRALVSRLADPGECVAVKRFAAQGLAAQETSPGVVGALIRSYRDELDYSVRLNAVAALQAHAGNPAARAELASILENDPSDDIRALAMASLALSGFDVERALAVGRKDASPKVRDLARSFSAQSP